MTKSVIKTVRFMLFRALALFITVLIGVYVTVLIANMGGHVDTIRKAEIEFGVALSVYADPDLQRLPASELQAIIRERADLQFRVRGLDRPFFSRSLDFLRNAITLNLGWADQMQSDRASRLVKNILLDRLGPTLLLFGTAQLILFFLAIGTALSLSRRYGSLIDRAVIALAPTSSAPGWFYGIFLLLIFAALLRVLPWGRMITPPAPTDLWPRALHVAKHMILPVASIVTGAVFASIYSWRTFFLIFSSEDYVELARAKGLSSRAIEGRYILRPTLPTIITSFLLLLITMWMGQIILETVFQWPGLGRMIYDAIQRNETAVIVGSVVIYAYLLAMSRFFLDFIYSMVDPRVRVGGGGRR